MSTARKSLDWSTQEQLGIDPEKFDIIKKTLSQKRGKKDKTCTMCGEFCAIRRSNSVNDDKNV